MSGHVGLLHCIAVKGTVDVWRTLQNIGMRSPRPLAEHIVHDAPAETLHRSWTETLLRGAKDTRIHGERLEETSWFLLFLGFRIRGPMWPNVRERESFEHARNWYAVMMRDGLASSGYEGAQAAPRHQTHES